MIQRAGTEIVNWYLLDEGGRVTIVDTGCPGYWPRLERELAAIGRTVEDVEAVVLTHAHVDHIGFAPRLQDERGTPVYLHEQEVPQATTGKAPPTEGSLAAALVRYPRARQVVFEMVRHGAARPPKLARPILFSDSDELDVPGRLRVVHTPGHSPGHCVLHAPEEGALFTGDAISGWSTVTGALGPILPPREFNFSTEQARASLDRIEAIDAETLYFGHGEPWTGGAAAAVAQARERPDRPA